jgi:HEAT repeat protein
MLELSQLHKQIKALHASDEQVRQEAIRCLKAYEGQDWSKAPADVVKPLVECLSQLLPAQKDGTGIKLPPVLRQSVINILGNIGPRSESTVPLLMAFLEKDVAANLREAAVTALGKIGRGAKAAVDKLVAVLDAECQVALACRVARSLGEIGVADHKVRAALVNLWLIPIQCPQSRVQVAIALCKLKIDARGLLPTLTATVVTSSNAHLRKSAAEALCWCRKTDPDVVPALTAALCDEDEEVHKTAEEGLARMQLTHDKALQLCGKQLAQSVHAEAALAKSGAPAVQSLIAGLKATEALGREKAARTLGLLGETALAAVPALNKALEDETKEVRLAAAKALWNVSKEADAVVRVLAKLLTSPYPTAPDGGETRRRFLQTVIEALGRIGPSAKAAVPALLKVAKDDNRLIRESAQRALRAVDPVSCPAGV